MEKKVIDIFTRRPLETTQDTEANDERSSEQGIFVGAIPLVMAVAIRSHQASTEALGEQLDNLMGDYLFMLDAHNANLEGVLELLKVGGYDPETQVIMISEEGKVWIVENPVYSDEDPTL